MVTEQQTRVFSVIAVIIGVAALIVGIAALAQVNGASAAPSKSDPGAYTVWFIEEAIRYYEREGREAAVDHYSSADSVDGAWYAVIVDADDTFIAHYNAEIIGESLVGPVGIDVNGYAFGEAMAAADETGRWVSYIFLNPATGEQQLKHSWTVRHDGLIFVSGWYEHSTTANVRPPPPTTDEPAAFTQHYVERAIEMYQREGRDKTFAYYSSSESAVDRWYLFIIDNAIDELVLHPNPSLLGAKSAQRRDSRGYAYGAEMLKTTAEGQWVSYFYRTYDGDRPVEEGDKHTWLKLHDGLIFASGWYDNVVPLPTKEEDPVGYTQWFVQDAVDVYDVGGLDALLERYNDPASVDDAWYIFAIDLDGTMLVHATAPELRGQSLYGAAGVDLAGNRFGPELMDVDEAGGWFTYYFYNPDNGDCEFKHSWAVRRGEVIIGSGWYESAGVDPLLPSKCEPAAYTVATVERAIARYRAEGREASLAYHNSMASVDGRFYVFIVDAASGEVIAHPADVYLGQDLRVGSEAFDDAGYPYARDLFQATADGVFVPNVLGVPTADEQNPFHNIEEVKHYYAVLEDGLIFASGWYTTPPTPDDPAEYARLLVGRALTMYDDRGLEATLAYHNSPESADGPWYVFVLEDRDGVLYTVAHPTRPDLVGTTRERIDANGFNYGEAFAAVTEEAGGVWVSYLFTHPQTRDDAPKHSWIVRRGDLLFAAGWYEGIR